MLITQAWQPLQAGARGREMIPRPLKGAHVVSEMQVKPYNVYVTVAYPPDTDTPGFAEENKTKVSAPLCPVSSL